MDRKTAALFKTAALLMALTLIAAGPDMARAGAGGEGLTVAIPLDVCYLIQDAADSRFILTIADQFGTQEQVRMGKPSMVCTRSFTTGGTVVEHGPLFDAGFLARFTAGESTDGHKKCYDVASPSGSVDAIKKVVDLFGTDTVDVKQLSMVCVPAYKDPAP